MTVELRAFEVRARILFATGGIERLGNTAQETGAERFLLVADPALQGLGIVDTALTSLERAGLQGETFLKVEPEPYLDNADEAAALGRDLAADLVIGMGGGSAMDTAKAAAMLINNEGSAEAYVGLNKVEFPPAATIMVPTTAGTGSEVTFTAVFTNRHTKAKGGINSPFLFPQIALLDAELTVSVPPEVTAATGMDALTHAIESVTS
ncbi:MAG: iron-containing alcohol dehydrogenase, partial [Deltaproteobacteria bacterium]|nr:iron-containing alcohol dehydrogenase [Deltaproteobacteria bacterium]